MRWRDRLTARLSEETPRRAAGIALAVALEALLLLLLFTLGIGRSDPEPETVSISSFDVSEPPAPAEEAEAETETASPEEPEAAEPQPEAPAPAAPLDMPLPSALPVPSARPTAQPAPTPAPSPTPTATSRIQAVVRSDSNYGPPDSRPRTEQDTPVVGTAPDGSPLYAARWYREPRDDELAGYLSTATSPGWGLIACKTAPDWRVEDCVILQEYPNGSGIARASQAAAWQFRVRPPRLGGEYQVGSWVRIRIDYTRSRRM